MEYRKIGKWGIKVSAIGFGSWLTLGSQVEERNSIALIHHAFSRGINFLDTANVYAHGQAEVLVGKALQSLKRDSIVLATKVYFPMSDGPNDKGLSRKHVFEQCHESLKRLNTDYIDIYQCHRFDPEIPMEELVQTMAMLFTQGKILYWGTSEWPADKIEDATTVANELHVPPPISNQPHYNMLDRKIEELVIPACKRLGIGQVVFSPLAQGILTGKYKPGQEAPQDSRAADGRFNMFMLNRGLMSDDNLQRIEKLAELAARNEMSAAQMALAWCLRLQNVSSVIIGATRSSQIDDNVGASGIKLDTKVIEEIDRILGIGSGAAIR